MTDEATDVLHHAGGGEPASLAGCSQFEEVLLDGSMSDDSVYREIESPEEMMLPISYVPVDWGCRDDVIDRWNALYAAEELLEVVMLD